MCMHMSHMHMCTCMCMHMHVHMSMCMCTHMWHACNTVGALYRTVLSGMTAKKVHRP